MKRFRKRLHNVTVNLTIKNIPEDVHATLKREAARLGQSLNAYVIRLLSDAADEARRRERMRASRPELERFVSSLPRLSSSVPLIREDRKRH